MNVTIYTRVSSKEQVEGTSLDSQEVACRDYASREGWTVVRVFVEQGESAKFADRTQLLELLSFCRDRQQDIKALLVWKLDRFARNIEDHYLVKAALRKSGVRVISVTEPVDNDPNGKLMEAILAGFAQFDNDVRALRTKQGMQQKIREGIFPWMPPLGYQPPRVGRKTEPDKVDLTCFRPIQKAWQLFAAGGYSKAAIVRFLRSKGVRGYRGNLISGQRVDHMFRNPFYAGMVRDPWTGNEYTGRHEPMVTRDQFAAVQALLDGSTQSKPHPRLNDDFPLRGLVRCPACSSPLTAGWSRGRHARYAYYSCAQKQCAARRKGIQAGIVHEEFADFLASLALTSSRLVTSVVEAIVEVTQAEAKEAEQANSLKRDLAKTADRDLQGLIALRAKDLIADDEFVRERDRLRRQSADARSRETDDSTRPLSDNEAVLLSRSLEHLPTVWSEMPLWAKEGFGKSIFPAGYVFRRIRTGEKGLLFRALEQSADPFPYVVPLIKGNSNRFLSEIRTFLKLLKAKEAPQRQAA